MFQTSESCLKLHAVVVLEHFLSEQCPTAPGVCVCVCVCSLLQVCVCVCVSTAPSVCVSTAPSVCVCVSTAPGVCVYVCGCVSTAPGVCVWVCVHCSRCVCVCECVCVCVCVCVNVCTWMGQIQRAHFTASYTLYNCEKKNKKHNGKMLKYREKYR